MALTRLYRLGVSPQRVSKGYLLAGSRQSVSAMRGELDGQQLARDIRIGFSAANPRTIILHSGWWWLHDQPAREQALAALTEATVMVAAAAQRRDCLLLPGAVRPDGETAWPDWVVGDEHQVGLLDDVEREVATNLFRTHAPVIIALTGHPGIAGRPEPLGSRRLAESGEHLATRYLTSASAKHLSLIEAELRRTTGIFNLRAMDVHPLGPAYPGGDGASLAVRCIDGQAFAGTVIAHGVFMQALTMAARRLVRAGRREGNTDQRLLERRRASAIYKGIDARVPAETSHRQGGRRPDRGAAGRDSRPERREAGSVALSVLALELVEQLSPELGTLEVTFEEFAPVGAWTLALGDSAMPRNEAEFVAARLRRGPGAAAELLAGLVASAPAHRPALFIDGSSTDPAQLRKLGGRWEAMLTEPPSGTRQRQVNKTKPGLPPGPRQPNSPGQPPRRRPSIEEIRRLAGLPDGDPAAHRELIAAMAAGLAAPGDELVPWLGSSHRDLVAEARHRLRPPGNRHVSCPLPRLQWGSPPVERACQLAADSGLALLRTTVPAIERDSVVKAATKLIEDARDTSFCVAVLSLKPFKQKDGSESVSIELLVLPKAAAT